MVASRNARRAVLFDSPFSMSSTSRPDWRCNCELLVEVGGRGMNEESGRCEVVDVWEVWVIGEGRGKRRFGMYSVGRNV